jgi:hypothetical protein
MMEDDGSILDIRWMAYMLGTALVETSHFIPVKVKRLPDGRARVTEQDGDQYTIAPDGMRPTNVNKDATLGSKAAAPASSAYTSADGDAKSYFGRGFVQLAWWTNYATAGSFLGRGLDFLFNPRSRRVRRMAGGAGTATGLPRAAHERTHRGPRAAIVAGRESRTG